MLGFIVNISRLLVSLTFIVSGFVKAIDPLGTQYKLQDYAAAVGIDSLPDWLTLGGAVALAAVEFYLGMLLLFAIRKRFTPWAILTFLGIMTVVTVWIYIANPVSDCGCFGDAIVLTNGETLLKNIILLALAAVVVWKSDAMPQLVSRSNRWIVRNYTVLFVLGLSVYSLYFIPPMDFRPYHVGANIREGMEIPEDAEQPEFETTFIMEKNGEQKEFSLENYPDSTWTFIDSKTKVIKQGYVPPIHDFSIQTVEEGDDITEDVMNDTVPTFLLVSPHLEYADDSHFGNIDKIYEYAEDQGWKFYCLTASGDEAIEHWKDITGAEYQFCHTDDVTLKTIIRSNPGLLLLKDGTVVGKWSHNELPEITDATFESFDMRDTYSPMKVIGLLLLFFVVPLVLLVVADRLWMWSRWLKRKNNVEGSADSPTNVSEEDSPTNVSEEDSSVNDN